MAKVGSEEWKKNISIAKRMKAQERRVNEAIAADAEEAGRAEDRVGRPEGHEIDFETMQPRFVVVTRNWSGA